MFAGYIGAAMLIVRVEWHVNLGLLVFAVLNDHRNDHRATATVDRCHGGKLAGHYQGRLLAGVLARHTSPINTALIRPRGVGYR